MKSERKVWIWKKRTGVEGNEALEDYKTKFKEVTEHEMPIGLA